MKRLSFVLLLFCCLPVSAVSTLNGKLKISPDSVQLEINYMVEKDGKWSRVVDEVTAINGHFFYSCNISNLTAFNIYCNNILRTIYVEPGDVQLQLDFEAPYYYNLNGTSVDMEQQVLQKQIFKIDSLYCKQIRQMLVALDTYRVSPDTSTIRDSLRQQFLQFVDSKDSAYRIRQQVILSFIKTHLSYQIVPDLLSQLLDDKQLLLDSVICLSQHLSVQQKESNMGKLLAKHLKRAEQYRLCKQSRSVGNEAPDFTRVSALGDTIHLVNYRNKKLVLLDFWASWCLPCRKQIPVIKSFYDECKGEDLEVIGISVDNDEREWNEVLLKEKMPWQQVLAVRKSDDFFETSDISECYQIQTIPAYILIDKRGVIVECLDHADKERIKKHLIQ